MTIVGSEKIMRNINIVDKANLDISDKYSKTEDFNLAFR